MGSERSDHRRRGRSRSATPESRRRRRSSTPSRHRRDTHRDDCDDRRRRETSADRQRHAGRSRRTYNAPNKVDAIASQWEQPTLSTPPSLAPPQIPSVSFRSSVLAPPPSPSTSVEVVGLDLRSIACSHVKSLFHQCGTEVISVRVDSGTSSTNHALPPSVIVQFHTVSAAMEAVHVMNGGWVNGKRVVVKNLPQTSMSSILSAGGGGAPPPAGAAQAAFLPAAASEHPDFVEDVVAGRHSDDDEVSVDGGVGDTLE